MVTTINWGALYQQGRCKDVGVSWSDSELYAVTQLHIPAEYVRLGCLTLEDYESNKARIDKEKSPLLSKGKDELLMLAHQKGIEATSAASKETLVKLLDKKLPEEEKPKPVEVTPEVPVELAEVATIGAVPKKRGRKAKG